VKHQVSIDFALAQYAHTYLVRAGAPVHWTVLAAAADAALVAGGGQAVLVDDSHRFSRVMRLAKVIGVQSRSGKNPMPLYEARGFWQVEADLLAIAKATRRALLSDLSRLKLISLQLDEELVRLPGPDMMMAATAAKVAVSQLQPLFDIVNDMVIKLEIAKA
jgi:hypothetical protein